MLLLLVLVLVCVSVVVWGIWVKIVSFLVVLEECVHLHLFEICIFLEIPSNVWVVPVVPIMFCISMVIVVIMVKVIVSMVITCMTGSGPQLILKVVGTVIKIWSMFMFLVDVFFVMHVPCVVVGMRVWSIDLVVLHLEVCIIIDIVVQVRNHCIRVVIAVIMCTIVLMMWVDVVWTPICFLL